MFSNPNLSKKESSFVARMLVKSQLISSDDLKRAVQNALNSENVKNKTISAKRAKRSK